MYHFIYKRRLIINVCIHVNVLNALLNYTMKTFQNLPYSTCNTDKHFKSTFLSKCNPKQMDEQNNYQNPKSCVKYQANITCEEFATINPCSECGLPASIKLFILNATLSLGVALMSI